MFGKFLLPALALALSATCLHAQEAPAFPPLQTGDMSTHGRNIQRTMRLLAESTPERRNTVRVLFYGQSITEQAWWKSVADDLRKRFPHANLIIENRAIGGHSAQLLVKTAEADLYPWQPDLMIFHVYGAHDKYEEIFRQLRRRTCAEVLQQNDHVVKPADLDEETDAAKLRPDGKIWDAFMNHQFLPGIALKYQTEFCDQRALWKQYLRSNQLEPKALLKDSVHLNPQGEFVMAEAVKAHLRYDPKLEPSPAEAWVKTLAAGRDFTIKDGQVTLAFEGNRVDAILGASGGTLQVRIDGKSPSEIAETAAFTRAGSYPQSNWPCLLRIGSQTPLVAEDWTLTLRETAGDWKTWKFDLTGSQTGADGSGTVGENFVSKSGRIVLDPADWNLDFCLKVFGPRIKDGFAFSWKAVRLGSAVCTVPAARDPTLENAVTLAQGLPHGPHILTLTGDLAALSALRVYTPPLP